MERKEYLERCRRAAMLRNRDYFSGAEIMSSSVQWSGRPYTPVAYQLAYEPDGVTVRHTAVLEGIVRGRRQVYYVRLSEVEAPEQKGE